MVYLRQVEMVGIIAAAQLANKRETVEMCIYSRLFLQCLTLECHNTLNSLADEWTIELLWTPGHRGIRGNEITDDLAKLGTW